MQNLFNKVAVFGDLHLGEHMDSEQHNQDCLDYIDWFCNIAKKENVDRIIFLGDYFHNRSRLRLDTINIGNVIINKLTSVAPVEMIVGNHDMFYKQNRTIVSTNIYANYKDVTIRNKCEAISGVGFVPYLVGTEYIQVTDLDVKYIFGHFELPGFLMNSSVTFPDSGQFNADGISKPEYVFSGHFHKRQLKKNKGGVPIWYIGNPFGHNFNDVNDTDRGMMILAWDEEPKFINWKDGPLHQRFKLSYIKSKLSDKTLSSIVRPTSILEITDDIDSKHDDVVMLKEELSKYVREVRLIEKRKVDTDEDVIIDVTEKPLADVVVEQLHNIDTRDSDYDVDLLVKLFEES